MKQRSVDTLEPAIFVVVDDPALLGKVAIQGTGGEPSHGKRRETGIEMHVLIADDHDLVRDALKLLLVRIDPNATIVESGNLKDAQESAGEIDNLDLVILNLSTLGTAVAPGVEFFHSRFPDARVVIMSGYYRRQDVLEALESGAAGFVPKSLSTDAMLNAFRLILSAERYIPEDVLPLLSRGAGERGANGPDGQRFENRLDALTGREREVLTKLIDGHSNKQIGRTLDIEEVTVKLHVRRIYQKLGAKNRAHAVKLALDFGWSS